MNIHAPCFCTQELCNYQRMEDRDIYRDFTRRRTLGQLLGRGIHRKKASVPLRGWSTTAFLQSQPQLQFRHEGCWFPQIVLLSPAPSTCVSRRLPRLDVRGLLQLNIYNTDHITSVSWNLLLLGEGSCLREQQQLRLLPLPHPPHYLTSSSVHSASWTSLVSSRLLLSSLSALCCRLPPSVACQSFLSGLLASQPATLPSSAHTAASVTFLKWIYDWVAYLLETL